MPRIQFDDVTPPERKRSIRNIPIPNGSKRKIPFSVVKPESEPAPKTGFSSSFTSQAPRVKERRSRKNKKWFFITATLVVIAIFIVGMMTVFASATIDITPKSQDMSVDMKMTGTTEMATSSVRFEVVKLSKSKSVSVTATGEEPAEIKASGKIVIYNDFSTDPQRLIIRTRFQTADGLIYRIPESVVVPGKTIKDGKDVPGSIETTIFADEAGDKYNIKKTDFTIPGFKSDANRYKNIYARSSTDITGGFVGNMKVVSLADKQSALQSVDSQVQADLKKDLESKVPEGLVLLPGSIIYNSVESPQKEEGSSVTFEKDVTAYAMMLNAKDLSDRIIDQYVSKLPEWNNIKPMINDFSLLNVSGLPDNLDANSQINFQISGQAKVFAFIDTDSINQRLLGAPRGDAAKLMGEFTGIKSVTAALRPIWKQSFPTNPSKIYVRSTLSQ